MKRRHAFTLVELLVVIGIIAILVSLILPALNRARAKAKDAQCLSNLHQITLGALVYAQDNHGALPPMRLDTGKAADGSLPTFGSGPYAYINNFVKTPTTAANPDSGAGIGRLAVLGYLGGKVKPDSTGNVDFSQNKVMYCPNSFGNGSYFWYQFNWHLAYRAGYGAKASTGYLQPWYKNVKNYGKAPIGAVPAAQIGSTLTQTLPLTATYAFPISPMSMANCTLDPYEGFYTVTQSSQQGAMPHDYGAGRKTFLLAYGDGHAVTVPGSMAMNRSNAKIGTLLDYLYSVEAVNQGAAYTTTVYGAWAPSLSN